MKFVLVEDLKPEMVTMKNLYNNNGNLLVAKNKKLTQDMINKIQKIGYIGLYIYDNDVDKDYKEIISDTLRIKTIQSLKTLNIDATIKFTHDIINELLNNVDSMCIDLKDLRDYDNYTYQHSINVAILSITIGIGMGFKKKELQQLGLSAILHDLGKLKIPKEILNKPSKLTKEEYEEVKKHSRLGYDLIKQNYNIKAVSKVGVLSHHENEDGTGYPQGLKSAKIHKFAKIIHVADVYDALTHKRVYKDAYSALEAIEYIMANTNIMFDEKVVEVFLKYIIVYPVGSYVLLSNNEKAIVLENNRHMPLRPIVRLNDGSVINLMEQLNITIIQQFIK